MGFRELNLEVRELFLFILVLFFFNEWSVNVCNEICSFVVIFFDVIDGFSG